MDGEVNNPTVRIIGDVKRDNTDAGDRQTNDMRRAQTNDTRRRRTQTKRDRRRRTQTKRDRRRRTQTHWMNADADETDRHNTLKGVRRLKEL